MNLNLSTTYADVQRIDRLLTNGLNLSSKMCSITSRFVESLLVSDMCGYSRYENILYWEPICPTEVVMKFFKEILILFNFVIF